MQRRNSRRAAWSDAAMRSLLVLLLGLAACSPSRTAVPSEPMGKLQGCPVYVLYGRFEAKPRTPSFDAAARAFDAALDEDRAGRHLSAAHGFTIAATHFLEAGDVEDRRWSYENAVSEWAMADRLDEARIALERAAATDPELAPEILRLRDELPTPCVETR